MLGEVLKSIGVYGNLVLIASICWLVSASNFEITVERREQAKQLEAYLLLKKTFTEPKDIDFTRLFLTSGTVSEFPQEGDAPTKGNAHYYHVHKVTPIVVSSPWSDHANVRLTVRALDDGIPAMRGRLLSISAESSTLPFSDYRVCMCLPPIGSNEPNPDGPGTLRILRKDAKIEGVYSGDEELGIHTDVTGGTPYGWESIATFLHEHGWKGTSPETLFPDYVSAMSAANDYIENVPRQEVAGVPIPITLLPYGIGGLVILASALQWGNIVALRRARRAHRFEETAWVMPPFGTQQWELRVSLFFAAVISCVAVALPGAAALSAGRLIATERSHGKPALWFLCCAFAMAVGMTGLTILEQFRLWQESRKSPAR